MMDGETLALSTEEIACAQQSEAHGASLASQETC